MNYPVVQETGIAPFYERPELDATAQDRIVAEVQQRTDAALIYSFKQGSTDVTELTVYGVFEVARAMNQRGFTRIEISDREPTVIDTDEYVEVRVYARDALNGSGVWGIKRQPKWRYDRDGRRTMEIANAIENGLSKAQRNAVRKLIPAHVAMAVINQCSRGKRAATVREDTTGARVSTSTRAKLAAGAAAAEEPPEHVAFDPASAVQAFAAKVGEQPATAPIGDTDGRALGDEFATAAGSIQRAITIARYLTQNHILSWAIVSEREASLMRGLIRQGDAAGKLTALYPLAEQWYRAASKAAS